MLLNNVLEASLIRANNLLSQEKNKKGLKNIQTEIDKMSGIFGNEFDKGLYKLLFDEIDFKDLKNLINSKNIKTQYFLQEFNSILEKKISFLFFLKCLLTQKT